MKIGDTVQVKKHVYRSGMIGTIVDFCTTTKFNYVVEFPSNIELSFTEDELEIIEKQPCPQAVSIGYTRCYGILNKKTGQLLGFACGSGTGENTVHYSLESSFSELWLVNNRDIAEQAIETFVPYNLSTYVKPSHSFNKDELEVVAVELRLTKR